MALVLVSSSCIEQNYPKWEGSVLEFQDAVERTPLAGETYPRITVANTVGTVSFRVNLVGAHRASDEIIMYSSVTGAATTAVSGKDYTMTGKLTIPKGSSFGTLTVNVVNTGRIGGSVDLLLQIDGNDEIGYNTNYNKVQLRITR
ncbi:DUF4843 domain-containing protein [Aquirufa sp.]|uniref:DUF4843 domain-containing protein n=1 Tax=Aquirufa sp. TaxID=2676249 RepID=UPI003784316D